MLTRRNNNDAVPEILAGIAPYSEIENNDLGIEQNMEIEANESWGEAIMLLDQNVGHIKRLCEGSSSCLLPTPKDQTDVNTNPLDGSITGYPTIDLTKTIIYFLPIVLLKLYPHQAEMTTIMESQLVLHHSYLPIPYTFRTLEAMQ